MNFKPGDPMTEAQARALDKKPLGRKAYGSIAHLPNSRMGPADHSCHEGQARICCEKTRDKHDAVIVTEKLDGSNVAIAKKEGKILALGRAGYLAETSQFEMHHLFADWVAKRNAVFQGAMDEGDTLHGEWLAQAHGTIYRLKDDELFAAFDLKNNGTRTVWDQVEFFCNCNGINHVPVLHIGDAAGIDAILPMIETSNYNHVDGETVEGAVWRVERKGKVDFLAKWVRPDKIDGKYLPGCCGNPENMLPVWNCK